MTKKSKFKGKTCQKGVNWRVKLDKKNKRGKFKGKSWLKGVNLGAKLDKRGKFLGKTWQTG